MRDDELRPDGGQLLRGEPRGHVLHLRGQRVGNVQLHDQRQDDIVVDLAGGRGLQSGDLFSDYSELPLIFLVKKLLLGDNVP